MDTDNTYNLLMEYAHSPHILVLLIILATFVLEDVATSAAALLAASGTISVELALISLVVGVIIGDLGLYGLGLGARKSPWIRQQLDKKVGQYTGKILHKREIETTIIARFIPGMRLPTYTAMGLFKASFKKFFFTVVIAVSLWTGFLFYLFYKIGEQAVKMIGTYQIASVSAVIILALILPYIIRFSVQKIKGK